MSDLKTSNAHTFKKLDSLAHWMDSRFVIPGTSIRFGLDSLLGIVPGIGDSVTMVSTVYLIGVAQSFKLPFHVTLLMIWNMFIDWIIGIIPLIGDIFDVGWKANLRNVALIKKHADIGHDIEA
ncbi:MAG: DUF4112 domain-containing protein [Alphaproteobacteria bacterium]|nr:DUF4112 domain-containing protein [Alphaproteobacteria bacterium]